MQAMMRAAALIGVVLPGERDVAAAAKPFLETGIPVFSNDNAANVRYRLPSILVTGKGTVVAVAQLRRGRGDFVPQELVCRRSADGGRTWGPKIVVRRNPRQQVCLFNGCIVEDTVAGKLLLHFIEFPFRSGHGDGWFGEVWLNRGGGHCQVVSTDDGRTWSEPVLQIPLANAEGWRGASGLNNNHGVQLREGPHRGRLVMNARVFKPGVTRWRAKGGIVYSDDHGETWRVGGVPFADKERYETEACLVEAAGGEIYVNYRGEGTRDKRRLYHRSGDGGATVSEQGAHGDLPPINCNAGLARYGTLPRSVLLLTLPAEPSRKNLTCYASFDEGRTWPAHRQITPKGGYSDVHVLPDRTILVLYELKGAEEGIALARFNLEWLTGGE